MRKTKTFTWTKQLKDTMRKQSCVFKKQQKTNGLLLSCVITPRLFVITQFNLLCFFSSLPANHNWFPFWKKMAPQQQHMLAWRFILLWLTVILTVSPRGWTVSLFLYFSLCFSSFSLIMSVSSTLSVTLLSLSFSLYLSIRFCLMFNPSIHFLPSSVTLLLFCLFQPPLWIPPLLSLHYIYFCHHCCLPLSYPTSSLSPTFPPTFSSSPTPSDSQMKGCKHVFHMRSHCAEPTEQNNHA